MKQFPSHFMAHIGIDWSDRKHDVCLVASEKPGSKRGNNSHLPPLSCPFYQIQPFFNS